MSQKNIYKISESKKEYRHVVFEKEINGKLLTIHVGDNCVHIYIDNDEMHIHQNLDKIETTLISTS